MNALEQKFLERVPTLLCDIAKASETIAQVLTEQKSEHTPKQPSVWVFTAEQCYDMQMFDVVVRTFATEKAARKFLYDFIHEDCGEGSIVDMVKEKGWDIDEDEPNHYYAGIDGSYLSNRVECTITECRIES